MTLVEFTLMLIGLSSLIISSGILLIWSLTKLEEFFKK